MYKNLVIACLLVALVSSTYFLTPAFPPTAHQNQFYSVRFRVRGLDDPTFTFQGLPKSLSGSSDGVISGIPEVTGSQSIVIKYRAGVQSGQKEVILKILPDPRKTDFIVQATQTSIGLVIEYPKNLIFRVGQTIQIPFVAKNIQGNLIWAFHNLPNGIKGNSNTGVVEGQIDETGYYNFNVECADSQGKSAEVFLTVNIQPKTSLISTKIVDVNAPKTTNSDTTLDKIESEQVAADNELFKTLDIVDTRKKIVADVKQHVAVATLRVQNAQASFNAADAEWKQAVSNKENAQATLRSAQKVLDATQKNLELALIEQAQSTTRVTEARKAVDIAQQRFNDAQKSVESAEDALVDAKDKMQNAEAALRTAQTEKTAAQEEYKKAVAALEAAKTQLEDAKIRKQLADQAVKAAKDAIEIAVQARDDAEADLQQADFDLDKAEKELDAALKKVAQIREKYNAAEVQYSQAKWNWETAVNKLYIVQARKEAADRASAIALAEGSLSDHNVNNEVNTIGNSESVSFSGCKANNYPLITGTSQVVSVSDKGYRLASGHNIIYGECSSVTKSAVGDFVNYNGYFVNGVVNALRI